MFQLSRAQIHAVSPSFEHAFDVRMTDMLLAKYESRGSIRTEGLVDYVATGRRHAQTLGFTAEQHLFDVVEAYFLTGDALWSAPEFQRITAAKLRTAEEKCVDIRAAFVPEPERPGLVTADG